MSKKTSKPAGERKMELVKAMRKTGAIKLTTAVPIADLATETGLDVYGLICGTGGKVGSAPTCLLATGHIKLNEEKAAYLTKKGIETKFDESPFVREAKAE